MKTIEEIREYAKEKVGEYDYLGNEYEAYLDGAQDAANHIMSLPLADRMTDEERELIKFAYGASKKLSEATANPNIVEVFKGQYFLLESIFGKSMFTEEGGHK